MLKKTIIAWVLSMLPLVGGAAQSTGPALTVHFEYQPEDLSRVRALHGRLDKAVRRAGVGEVDEAELHADGNDGYFDMRGPDPERIYRVVAPILRASSLMSGAEITKKTASGRSTFPLR